MFAPPDDSEDSSLGSAGWGDDDSVGLEGWEWQEPEPEPAAYLEPAGDDKSLLKKLGIRFTPLQYWRLNGYNDNHAYRIMPHLQQLILDETRHVINGDYIPLPFYEKHTYDAQINISHMLRKNGRIDHRKPEKRAVIPHDDALMPMWRALAGAIRNRNECANKRFKLDFTGVELPEELLQVIFGSLHDKNVIAAQFRSANLTEDAFESILRFAVARPMLSGLGLGQNDLFGRHPAILESVSSLQHVTSLDLPRCKIDAEGAKILGRVLQSNPVLKRLDITHNQLGDEGTRWLASALRSNTTLKRLKMEHNALTRVGHVHLATALMDNSSLAAIIASNHSCHISCDNIWGLVSKTDENYEKLLYVPAYPLSALDYAAVCYCYDVDGVPKVTPANSAARKILFSIRDNVHRCPMYFADLELGVLTRLLRLIQLTPSSIQKKCRNWTPSKKYLGDRRVLSSVFETIKYCFVPQLACSSGHRLSKRKHID